MASVVYDFRGKTALVTGAGRGIGRTTAKALCAAGAVTYALSKTKANLDSLKIECPDIHTVCVDLCDWDATKKAVEALGPIDLLVNNAGTITLQAFLEVDPATFDEIYNLNVKAIICVSQVVAKGLIARGSPGAIVNVSSVASRLAVHDYTAYGSSKAAVDQLTRIMALELGPSKMVLTNGLIDLLNFIAKQMLGLLFHCLAKNAIDCANKTVDLFRYRPNIVIEAECPLQPYQPYSLCSYAIEQIRVNAVNPTVVMTDLGKVTWSDPDRTSKILERHPLGKFAGDVANAILFLLSDNAALIHGTMLPVDGGLLVS